MHINLLTSVEDYCMFRIEITRQGGKHMRTTLDLPNELIDEAMKITHAKNKTELITIALQNIIRQNKYNKLINFHGRVKMDIDLDILRKR
jgi:hypothetical protein